MLGCASSATIAVISLVIEAIGTTALGVLFIKHIAGGLVDHRDSGGSEPGRHTIIDAGRLGKRRA